MVIRDRSTLMHGSPALQGPVPVSTPALNNEVAHRVTYSLNIIAFEIRLTGLRGATYLKGTEGAIRRIDPANR